MSIKRADRISGNVERTIVEVEVRQGRCDVNPSQRTGVQPEAHFGGIGLPNGTTGIVDLENDVGVRGQQDAHAVGLGHHTLSGYPHTDQVGTRRSGSSKVGVAGTGIGGVELGRNAGGVFEDQDMVYDTPVARQRFDLRDVLIGR